MQNKPSLPASIFGLLAVVTAFLILAPAASMSAKTKTRATAGTVRNVCGQPVNVKNHGESRSLDPVKTTFELKGRSEEVYYFNDRYFGEHVDTTAWYELKVTYHQDGRIEVLDGRRVSSCQNNPMKG